MYLCDISIDFQSAQFFNWYFRAFCNGMGNIRKLLVGFLQQFPTNTSYYHTILLCRWNMQESIRGLFYAYAWCKWEFAYCICLFLLLLWVGKLIQLHMTHKKDKVIVLRNFHFQSPTPNWMHVTFRAFPLQCYHKDDLKVARSTLINSLSVVIF